MKINKKVLMICVSALLALIVCGVAAALLLGGNGSEDPGASTSPTEATEPEVLSVKEVLETPDLTHVVFEGVVTGFDFGKRHMIIEDVDGSCAIQLYKNPGYAKAKVGDLVRVDGYRTYDKSLDRITPNTLEILSSGNPCTADTPIVLDASELQAWTNENRTNAGIMFKTYTFKHVEILEISGSYTYIDCKYDEEGGRGLKIGIKNDASYVDVGELKLVQGQKYNITGILYGVSDDFADESRDGIVLRMSVLSVEDAELVIENPEDSTVLASGQRSFLLEDEADKPDFTTYFTVIDPVDGVITVTADMITEQVDMTKEGTYPVTFTYTSSSGAVLTKTIQIYVTANGLPVSQALELVPELIDLHVHGVVVGWTYKDSQKTAMVIEDPVTGEAVEMWTNNKADFQKLNVGDHVVVYSSALGYEKELPRLSGEIRVVKTLETGVELTPATVIKDLGSWSSQLKDTQGNFYGRYTFTADFVKTKGNYAYFLNASEKTGNIIQIALYQSAVAYDFVPGNTYTVTAVAAGISDGYASLEEKSITIRMSVMNKSDIKLVSNNQPPVKEEKPKEKKKVGVSGAIQLLGTDTPAIINGYVAGFVTNGDGNHTAVILQDTETGECIEFWANDHSEYREVWNTYAVGDHVTISTDKIVSNKGLPRAGSKKNGTAPVKVNGDYKISTGNPIQVKEIADMESFLRDAIANGTNILGKYTYTGTVTNEDGYLYATDKGDGHKLKLELYNSPVSANFENGKKYSVTFSILAYSKALSTEEDITLRIAILEPGDVEEIVEIPEDADYTVSITGARELLAGTAKPDFSAYFAVLDEVDGAITVTGEMLTDNVDMAAAGTYEVKLSCKNSEGKQISEVLEIKVINSLSVSEAIRLLGTETPAYINGYVAGYSVDGDTRKAVILQDPATGECIEFWASDSGAYNEVWSTYAVGDHVTVYAESIVDNKGLPRANKTVIPMEINGSYKMSTGNAIQMTEITDMDAFMNSVYSDGKNTLGVYRCTVTVADGNYFHQITTDNGKLRIQLYQSAAAAELEVGKTYTMTFVLTGYNKALSNTGNLYVRVSVMDAGDIAAVTEE